MNMEKYNELVDDFSVAYCNIKEEDIMLKANYTKRKNFKTFVAIAACFALIFVGTTVATATGWLDLSGLFSKLFHDQVTEDLIEEGALSKVNISAQSGNYDISFEGITGDSNTQFGVFKLVDKTGELGDPALVQIDVTMVGMSVVEDGRLSEYTSCLNDSFTVLEEEEDTYYIKVHLPSHWIYYSDEDIYISLKGVTAYYGDVVFWPNSVQVEKADRSLEIPFDFVHSFAPDRSVFPKSKELTIEKTLISEVSEFTLKTLDLSRYNSELIVTFPTQEGIIHMADATALWHSIDKDYIFEYLGYAANLEEWNELKWNTIGSDDDYEVFGIQPPEEGSRLYKTVKNPSDYSEGDIKLFVDGVEISRTKSKYVNWASAMDSTDNPDTWGIIVSFDAVDLSSEKSIEIRYLDQIIPVK